MNVPGSDGRAAPGRSAPRKSAPRRGAPRRGRLWIADDSDAVFAAAIAAGVLSEDPDAEDFAGLYMYMHHDRDGAAWFKHRETRAYVTMGPEPDDAAAGNRTKHIAEAASGRRPKRPAGPGLGLWATVALAGAFLAGALIDFDFERPGIGTVRLDELTAEFLAGAVRSADSPEASAEAARIWGAELEAALDAVAERHGVALLPAGAVAAGASDYTAEVRAAMPRWPAAEARVPDETTPETEP